MCVEIPGQTGVVPVIAPGIAGVPGFTTTAFVCGALVPHEFPSVTVISPPVVPDVTVIEFVPPPLVIAHPAGTVQLYVTFETLEHYISR